MTEDLTKTHKITFQKSLPMGTRGTFTHENELWIAYPASKNQRIHAIVVRLLGILNAINDDMIRHLNAHPADTDMVLAIAERVARGNTLSQEISRDTGEAFTA